MRTPPGLPVVITLVFSALAVLWWAGGAPSAADTSSAQPARAHDSPPAAREELEKRFAEALSGATLAGKWRLVKDGEIGEERAECYSLGKVEKLDGDRWMIEARIQYGERDFSVPVAVKVLWAGDTPVISVTDWGVPALGIGPYTARVMVYNGLYTGTWFGKGYGGLMSGRVERGGEDAPPPPKK
jgi:hypothetical protein